MSRSLAYWTTIGWWYEPTKWLGHAILWLTVPVLGVWESYRHNSKKQTRSIANELRKLK